MLTANTGGKSSRRSLSQANGITSLGTSIHQGRKNPRTNRCTYRSSKNNRHRAKGVLPVMPVQWGSVQRMSITNRFTAPCLQRTSMSISTGPNTQ